MMLFEVRTKKYETFYVVESSFEAAKRKVELKLQEIKEKEGIIAEDGSLRNLEEKPNIIISISCLTDDLIQ